MCPTYEEIVEESSMKSFSADSLSGLWYMVATNEPTLPSGCTCSTNNYTVSTADLTYSYVNADRCYDSMDINVHISGEIDADNQGSLVENGVVHGHVLKPLKPNYIFALDLDSNGEPTIVYTYACLGKVLGLKEEFSFNVLSRKSSLDSDEINELVNRGKARAGVDIDTEKIRLSTEDDYVACLNPNRR